MVYCLLNLPLFPLITTYCDSNWDSNIDDRRSTIGFCVFLGDNLQSWSSKKQTMVSRSSTEVEYRRFAVVVNEISWLKSLLFELDVPISHAPTIFCDNLSVIYDNQSYTSCKDKTFRIRHSLCS